MRPLYKCFGHLIGTKIALSNIVDLLRSEKVKLVFDSMLIAEYLGFCAYLYLFAHDFTVHFQCSLAP